MISKDHLLFNAFCCATVLGIWPRFIEPELLSVKRLKFSIPGLKRTVRVLQLSDLHFGKLASDYLLKKILYKSQELRPDLIVLTGDFLCYGQLQDAEKLSDFLKALKAPLGVFAILGNHDYEGGVTVDEGGNYAVAKPSSAVLKGFELLFKKQKLTGVVSKTAQEARPNRQLLDILDRTGVELLVDRTVQVHDLINVTGISEYMTGQINLTSAYKNYNQNLPGILLAHNPDAIPTLLDVPSSLILSGHTHGGQINLPWFRERFTLMENPHYFTGLLKEKGKSIYISRGLGSVMPFRFFASPEMVMIELSGEVKGES